MNEEWKTIAGYEGLYEISNLGMVRSVDRLSTEGNRLVRRKGRVLKTSIYKGYISICLWRDGKSRGHKVHRLVAAEFIRPINSGEEVNHKDFDRQNNQLSNLEITSKAQNYAYSTHAGRRAKVLTHEEAREIKLCLLAKQSKNSLAKKFGVSRTNIRAIATGKTWQW